MRNIQWINTRWFLISLFILLVDQWTKNWVFTHLRPFEPLKIFPFFNILLSFNTGAAWSFLDSAGGWQQWLFGGIAVCVSVVAIFFILNQERRKILVPLSLSLILGGAIGNVFDRIIHGYVIDFLHFHFYQWSFAIFNIADAAITVGAFLMIVDVLVSRD